MLTESNILNEGLISWLQDTKEIGQFIMKLANDPKLLDNVSAQINKWTFARYIKNILRTLSNFIKTLDHYIQNNMLLKEVLTTIKNKIIWFKNFILTTYNSLVTYKGFKKLIVAVAFSGLVAKIYDLASGFFKYITDFVKNTTTSTSETILKSFEGVSTFFGDIDALKNKIIGAVSRATGDLSGLSIVVSIVSGIKEALTYIYAILKAAMDKFGRLVVGGSHAIS